MITLCEEQTILVTYFYVVLSQYSKDIHYERGVIEKNTANGLGTS